MKKFKIIITFVLVLSFNFLWSSFATLFPESDPICPYHSHSMEFSLSSVWHDMFETDENLFFDGFGYKCYLFGDWLHYKYFDGHWECKPFDEYFYSDYYATFCESSNGEFFDLKKELVSGPVRRSDESTPKVLDEPLKFYFKSHKNSFKILLSKVTNPLMYPLRIKTDYYISDYILILKNSLEYVSKGRKKILKKIFNGSYIIMMNNLIDNNGLRTFIYFRNEKNRQRFKLLYNDLKQRLDFIEDPKFKDESCFYAENLYFMACKFYIQNEKAPFEIENYNRICSSFQLMLKYISEKTWIPFLESLN